MASRRPHYVTTRTRPVPRPLRFERAAPEPLTGTVVPAALTEPPRQLRYPVQAVLDVLGDRPVKTLEPSLRRAVYRAKSSAGLSEPQADRIAVALGYHPAQLWPDLW